MDPFQNLIALIWLVNSWKIDILAVKSFYFDRLAFLVTSLNLGKYLLQNTSWFNDEYTW